MRFGYSAVLVMLPNNKVWSEANIGEWRLAARQSMIIAMFSCGARPSRAVRETTSAILPVQGLYGHL